MATDKNKLTINRGTSFDITLNYKENGVAASLVGATVYFTVKASESDSFADDSSSLIKKTVTSHQNPAGGVSLIELSDSDTYIAPATYFYDIRVKKSNGKTYKVVEGKLKIDGSATNRNVA